MSIDTSILDVVLAAPEDDRHTLVTPHKMTQYLRYMNVRFPPRLSKFSMSKGRDILSLRWGQAMASEIVTSFPKASIPEVFENNGLHSHFLVNF
jgi:hypothetical protein